jgi:hypothetical protein
MKPYPRLLIAAVMAAGVASTFAQGTVVFNNGTGTVRQWTQPDGGLTISVPPGGGFVQLFWAATGTAYIPWTASLSAPDWYAANPGWSSGPVTGFTLPEAGKFDGGEITLNPLTAGGSIDYVIVGWTGGSASFDEALATTGFANVSSKFTSGTGNPTIDPPGSPVPLADSFAGMTLIPVPEPSSTALVGLGAATLLALRRRE